MTSPFVTALAGLAVTLSLVAVPAAAQTFPKPSGRVTDLANVIDPATEAAIDARLERLERETSSEVAVLTVTTLEGTSVEDYAVRIFKEWGIGQAKQDNGVLVLVAPNEREMRIEVGYGLEGVMPDGLAGDIIREQFIPRFRDNDYNGGIRDGVNRVVDVVEKHQVLSAEEIARLNDAGLPENEPPPWWFIIPFLSLFVAIGFTMIGLGLRTKTGFPLLFGSLFGGMPLMMGMGVAPRLAPLTLLPLAVGMAVVGFRLGKRDGWRNAFRKGGDEDSGDGGGWKFGGGGSSSGSSSNSSSGSSSSFGGGSSGGGGASGRW